MRKQGCRAVALSLKREEELWNRDVEQLLQDRSEKKSLGNKGAEQLLRVRREMKS